MFAKPWRSNRHKKNAEHPLYKSTNQPILKKETSKQNPGRKEPFGTVKDQRCASRAQQAGSTQTLAAPLQCASAHGTAWAELQSCSVWAHSAPLKGTAASLQLTERCVSFQSSVWEGRTLLWVLDVGEGLECPELQLVMLQMRSSVQR